MGSSFSGIEPQPPNPGHPVQEQEISETTNDMKTVFAMSVELARSQRGDLLHQGVDHGWRKLRKRCLPIRERSGSAGRMKTHTLRNSITQ